MKKNNKIKQTRAENPISCLITIFILITMTPPVSSQSSSGYISINDLAIYYEIHPSTSSGQADKNEPLILLHGAFGSAEDWQPMLPILTETRRVIAVDLEGHGRTRDLERPLSYKQMGDDTAALLMELGIQNADFFGYSLGGVVALRIAIKYPELVRKLAMYGSHGGETAKVYEPEMYAQYQSIPDDFDFPEIKDPYVRLAPNPERWPVLVRKIRELGPAFKGYTKEELGSIGAKVLIMQGDRDVSKPEHAVDLYRLIPNSQLAIYPDGDHFMPWTNQGRVLADLLAFLNKQPTGNSQ